MNIVSWRLAVYNFHFLNTSNLQCFDENFSLDDYGMSLVVEDNKTIIDTLTWNGTAKKSGLDMGDIINEFKIENQNRPKKEIIYPIALILLSIFGYLNIRRRI